MLDFGMRARGEGLNPGVHRGAHGGNTPKGGGQVFMSGAPVMPKMSLPAAPRANRGWVACPCGKESGVAD